MPKRPASINLDSRTVKRSKVSGIRCFFKSVTVEQTASELSSKIVESVSEIKELQTPPLTSDPVSDNLADVLTTFPVDVPASPHHPGPSQIPPKKTATQNIYFQDKWYKDYPWLTYDSALERVLCHDCLLATKLDMMNLVKKSDDAFSKLIYDDDMRRIF